MSVLRVSVWRGVVAAFITIVLVLVEGPWSDAAAQARDTRTWYQAYRDAQTKIQQRNWQGALNDLDVATRAGAPRPGRNINFYGDTFDTYNPDYYRGVALSNLQRYAEADQAFTRVQAARLIDPKDSVYAEFARLSASVKDSVKQLAAQLAGAAGVQQTTAQQSAAQQPTGAQQSGNAGGASAGATVTSGQPSNTQPSNTLTPAQAAAVTQPAVPAGIGGSTTTPPANAPAYSPPNNTAAGSKSAADVTARPPAASTKAPVPRPATQPQTTANARATVSPNPPIRDVQKEERAGILAFFTGDYAGAAQLLKTLADAGVASPRTFLYLASSQAALVLTGDTQRIPGAINRAGAPTPSDAIREAQAFASQVGNTTPYARDLALISPRIKTQLGLRP